MSLIRNGLVISLRCACAGGMTSPPPEVKAKGISLAADRKSTRLNPVTNAHLVCRLLLEKKKNGNSHDYQSHPQSNTDNTHRNAQYKDTHRTSMLTPSP